MNVFIIIVVLFNTWLFSRFVRNHAIQGTNDATHTKWVVKELQELNDSLKKLLDSQ